MGEKTVMGKGGLISTFASVLLHTTLRYFSVFSCIKLLMCVLGCVKLQRERGRENDRILTYTSGKEHTVIMTILCRTSSYSSPQKAFEISVKYSARMWSARKHNDHIMPYTFIQLSAKVEPQKRGA